MTNLQRARELRAEAHQIADRIIATMEEVDAIAAAIEAETGGEKPAAMIRQGRLSMDDITGALPAAGCDLELYAMKEAGEAVSAFHSLITGEGEACEPTPLELASLLVCLEGDGQATFADLGPARRAALFLFRLHPPAVDAILKLRAAVVEEHVGADDVLWQARSWQATRR